MRSIATEFPASQAAVVQRDLLAMSRNIVHVEALDRYQFTEADLDAKFGGKLATAAEYADRGRKLFGKRAYARAIGAFDSALALDARHDGALAGRAESHFWKGEPAAAVKDANAALAVNPKNSLALAILGGVTVRNNDAKGGLVHLDQAVLLDPSNAFIHGERAGAYLSMNQFDQALSESAEALRLSKTWIEMYELRVDVLTRKHDWPALAKELETMLEKHPDNVRAQTSAAYSYALMARLPEALRAADNAIDLEPSEYRHMLRASLRPHKDYEARRKDIDEAWKLKPDSVTTLFARGQLLADMGNYEDAAAIQTAALKLSPEYRAQILVTRGVHYVKAGKPELAEADFRDALGKKSDATVLNNFCWELATTNVLLERALAECELALTLKPGNAAYLDSKGMALLQLGRYEESIKAYDAALAASPTLTMSLFGRGLARQRLCSCDAGNADMEAARKLEPTVGRRFEYYGIDIALAAPAK